MKDTLKRILQALYVPLIFVAVIWMIKITETVLGVSWATGGVLPRHQEGSMGILTSPLLHANFWHLYSNTAPLLILGWCLFYFYRRISWMVFPLLWLLSGILTWCIGREAWHIGASGMIYALASFLFFSGIFRKYLPLLMISVLVVFFYGGLVWGLLPTSGYISWEGHLSGAIAGYLVAKLFCKENLQRS